MRFRLPSASWATRFRTLTLTVVSLICCAGHLHADEQQRIAGFQTRCYAIVEAQLVVAPGQLVERGTLVIRDGQIIAAGKDVSVPADANTIDARGMYVYPGFINAATSESLDSQKTAQPDSGRKVDFGRYVLAATRPDNRKSLTPEFHAADAFKPDSKRLDAYRNAGFTAFHVLPTGRIASGYGAMTTTSGQPPRESLLQRSTLAQFQLFPPRGNGYPTTLMGATAHLRQAFLDAEHFEHHWQLYEAEANRVARPPLDPVLSALSRIRKSERPVVFHANSRDDIHRSLAMCREQGLSAILAGATEAHLCLEQLQQEDTALIVRLDFGKEPKVETPEPAAELLAEIADPPRYLEDRVRKWKARVAALGRFSEAGIRFAVSSENLQKPDEILQNMRLAIEQGLSPADALAALTIQPATMLAMEDRLGTLAVGKLGHVAIFNAPFEDERSQVRYVLVDGQLFEYNPKAKTPSPEKEETPATVALTGRWLLNIKTDDANTVGKLQLAQTGAKLNGVLDSEHGSGKLTLGSVKGNNVEFVVGIGAGDRVVELKFQGKLEESELAGTLKTAFGGQTTWSAKRDPADQPGGENPIQISLDAVAGDKPPQPKSQSAQNDTSTHVADWPTELHSDRIRRKVQTNGQLLIRNATVLTGTGETLKNTSILVREGKIIEIGPDLQADPEMVVIDATDRYVMPGIIDTHSHIMIDGGINESSQSIVPEVRIKDVIESDDTSEYRALAGGVTAARILHGSANVVGGQDAVVKLKFGATAAEHILSGNPQGVKFALGENVKYRTTRFPNTRMGVEATLNRAFLEAIDYRRAWMQYENARKNSPDQAENLLPPRRDLRLDALAGIVNHEIFIHSHCYRADEILMLLRVTSNLGIRVWSLQHVLEGYKIAPEIVAHGASCSTFSDWWAYKVEAYDATPYNAALLHEAGANVVIKSDDSELIRHLYLEAAKTVRYGNLAPEAALQTITRNPARELGLSDRMGTIEVGKDADLAIFNGHPLNAFARCEQTIIDGQIYFTRSEQPTAMLAAGQELSSHPAPLVFPAADIRNRELDMTKSDDGRYAIVGATLHPIDQPDIAEGTLLIEEGKIAAVGHDVVVPTGTKTIDAAGLHVYPGLIDAGTTLGLTEIGKVRETHDYAESGALQPDLRAGVAVNPDSELIAVARAGGITTALVHPTAGTIAGQASLIQLAGWTAPEMVVDYEFGLQVNWPSGDKSAESIEELRDFLKQARYYNKLKKDAEEANAPISDPRLEALSPYLAGTKPVLIEANSRRAIAEALLFADEEKLKIIIAGGRDAWKLADELKARNVPVIVGPVMRRPGTDYDPFDAPYANPGRLFEAGVKFCIRSNHASNSRNAPFEAAMAVAYGLSADEGLKAVTLSAAEILDIHDEVGSLTPGKRANVLITDGSPLQQTTQPKGIFINGTPFFPESRHTRFYKRYRERLHEVHGQRLADTPTEEPDETAAGGSQ